MADQKRGRGIVLCGRLGAKERQGPFDMFASCMLLQRRWLQKEGNGVMETLRDDQNCILTMHNCLPVLDCRIMINNAHGISYLTHLRSCSV